MAVISGDSGIKSDAIDAQLRAEFKRQEKEARDRRREAMRDRLRNWGAYHRVETDIPINRASGIKTANMIHGKMKESGKYRTGFEEPVPDYPDIDEEDAKHIGKFVDELGWSQKTVIAHSFRYLNDDELIAEAMGIADVYVRKIRGRAVDKLLTTVT